MDLGNAIGQVADLARGTTRTTVMEVKQEPAGTYYLVGPTGLAERKVAAPAWHNETLDTPAELRQFIKDNRKQSDAVFFDESAIVYVYDLDDRRHRAACPLKLNPQFKWLRDESAQQFRQPDFIRLLRITLKGCVSPDSNLLQLVRQLKFNATQDGGATIQHGKESIGRNITAQVTGEAAIPEEVTLMLSVFENFRFAVNVLCAVEINPHDQTFRLTPYPLQLRAAMDLTMDEIDQFFEADDLPNAYRGNP